MNYLETTPISLHIVGDKSNETFTGTFHVFRRLSHRLELFKDRKYRELIGPNPLDASEDNRFRAEVLAELAVAFSLVPDWFKESEFGQNLVDNNVIVKIYEEVMLVRKAAIDEIQSKAKDATVELKKVAEAEKAKQ